MTAWLRPLRCHHDGCPNDGAVELEFDDGRETVCYCKTHGYQALAREVLSGSSKWERPLLCGFAVSEDLAQCDDGDDPDD